MESHFFTVVFSVVGFVVVIGGLFYAVKKYNAKKASIIPTDSEK